MPTSSFGPFSPSYFEGPAGAQRRRLYYAVADGRAADLKALLCKSTLADVSFFSLLAYFAVEKGDVPCAVALLAGLPTLVDMYGMMLINNATESTARELLRSQPCLATASSEDGVTALHFAAGKGSYSIVRLLLRCAPETALLADIDGRLPLHYAAEQGHVPCITALLRTAGEAAMRVDLHLRTPLHLAAAAGHAAATRRLLHAAPTAAMALSSTGHTPLHLAARQGHADAVAALLAVAPQAAMVLGGGPGWTALQVAAFNGNLAVVQLLASPAAAEVADSTGRTALYVAAVDGGHASVVPTLVAAAPHTAIQAAMVGPYTIAPLQAAIIRGRTAAAEALLDAAPHVSRLFLPLPALVTAAALGQLGLVKRLVELDSEVVVEGMSILFMALVAAEKIRRSDVVELLAPRALQQEALLEEQWACLPMPCPGLGAALPAALARSAAEAGRIVAHMPAEDRTRLQAAALALGRGGSGSRRYCTRRWRPRLPGELVAHILARIFL